MEIGISVFIVTLGLAIICFITLLAYYIGFSTFLANATPVPADAPPRTPDALSKVVRARHAGAWDGDALVPEAIRQMLDNHLAK